MPEFKSYILPIIRNDNRILENYAGKNVPVRDKKEAQQDADVKAVIAEVEASLGDNGRVLVRESGTEPVVRVMVEADTDEKCLKNVNKIVDKMIEKGFVIKR